MQIDIIDVSKTFGRFVALDHIDLSISHGELVALLGPSGSGKTTLLRIIAGLEWPDPGCGRLLFDGEDVTYQPAARRRIGFVFQHYALFRHMTVFDNVAFGLRMQRRRLGLTKQEITDRVISLLRLVQLEHFRDRYPHQLSGGQRQRVALARALAVQPQVLLLDEPFGALDAKVRRQLRTWLRKLHDEIGVTSIFVTHDQDEALELADRVVVMNEGRIEQIGTPDEVYNHPNTPFVTEFIGSVNRFRGYRQGGHIRFGTTVVAEQGHEAVVFVRPHEFTLSRFACGEGFWSRIVRSQMVGAQVRVWLEAESGEAFVAEIDRNQWDELEAGPGEQVFVSPREIRCFDVQAASRVARSNRKVSA
ncbi:MAG TPA: sulfate/molybdate ABC transporter ATP-binding protein [Thermogutta sp.]|nr:sulfate/molybdate ABC transporter ATP-binding protein [Thermogutta sp.]